MTNRELAARLDRLEEKVDKLLFFRGWVLGAAAGMSALVAMLSDWVRK